MEMENVGPEISGIEVVGGKYIVRLFEDIGVRLYIDRIRSHREGNYTGRVQVEAYRGSAWARILDIKSNLSALRSRKEIADTLQRAHPFTDGIWQGIIERSFQLVIEMVERGEPVVQLVPRSDMGDPTFIIDQLVIAGNVTLLYGPGGSGKSLLALWLGLIVENGFSEDIVVQKRRCLYLDWETDREITERRLSMLAAMTPFFSSFPLYRRCVLPLADDEEAISLAIAENEIGLIIVDSAGMACGGDILSAEAAIRFFSSLRRVLSSTGAAALVISHVAKGERGKDERSPIGSVYFENIPRLVFEIRAYDDQDALDMVLRCVKANEMKRPPPIGFRAVFGNGFIHISRSTPPEDLSTDQTHARLVMEALAGGALSVGQIVEITGLKASTVRPILSRLQRNNLVIRLGRGLWGLAHSPDR